jgi:hypothetical protein
METPILLGYGADIDQTANKDCGGCEHLNPKPIFSAV